MIHLEVNQTTVLCFIAERKVRAPAGRVPGNAWEMKVYGKCHSGIISSALTEQDVSHALISLQKVVYQLPQDDLSLQTADHVTLRHRAPPLIGLLEHAQKHHYHVMWD
jgi:hypothetical protein